jgi:uncharacterized membrane protein YhhN
MKNASSWLILFLLALAGNITGILIKNNVLQYVSKPLIVISLALYFATLTGKDKNKLGRWILFALFFSWVGDILLLFQEAEPDFFLLGLAAFLIAHIFYIIFFHRIRVLENIRSRIAFVFVVAVYYAALIIWLSPYLEEMKLPVRIYGIVISFMLLLALHMLFSRNKIAGKWMVIGAVLFVISDSILAVNKFYQPFEMAGVLVMLTYGMAQLFLVKGSARYISSANTN